MQDFRDAGINVLMLTGDKGATARSLATQCLMLNPSMKVYQMSEKEDFSDQLEIINCKAKQKYRAIRAQREGDPKRAQLVQKPKPRSATINDESVESSLIVPDGRFKSVNRPGKMWLS